MRKTAIFLFTFSFVMSSIGGTAQEAPSIGRNIPVVSTKTTVRLKGSAAIRAVAHDADRGQIQWAPRQKNIADPSRKPRSLFAGLKSVFRTDKPAEEMSDRDRNGDIPGGVRQERRKKSGKKIENSERTVTMVAYMNTGSMRDIRGIPIKPPESRNKNRSVSASTKRAERIKMKTRMRELEDNENQALAARMGPDRGNSGVLATAFSKLKIAKPVTDDRKYGLIVARYARAYGVPVELAHAVIKIESNYRVNARGRAGEIGLMQIKPSTARLMGYSGSVKDLYSPEINIKYGMMYLGKAHQLGGGSTCGTILKYNAGHGARRMNPISSRYCSKVKRQIAQGI